LAVLGIDQFTLVAAGQKAMVDHSNISQVGRGACIHHAGLDPGQVQKDQPSLAHRHRYLAIVGKTQNLAAWRQVSGQLDHLERTHPVAVVRGYGRSLFQAQAFGAIGEDPCGGAREKTIIGQNRILGCIDDGEGLDIAFVNGQQSSIGDGFERCISQKVIRGCMIQIGAGPQDIHSTVCLPDGDMNDIGRSSQPDRHASQSGCDSSC